MARTCTVCRHERHAEMNQALVEGVALREVAKEYGVSKSALDRHQAHVAELIASERGDRQRLEGGALVARLEEIHQVAREIMLEARESSDDKLALRALGRMERQLALAGRLLGEIKEAPAVQIVASPEWVELRAQVLKALAPHPAAKKAVLEALKNAA